MRGAQVTELGSPPQVVDLEDVDGIRIEAVALNPLDIAVGTGVFYGGHPPLPYVPGCEAAGRADDGALVYLFGDGRGVAKPGFLAERVVVSGEAVLRLPVEVDPALAVAAGIAGIAGWVAVAWKAKVGPGDRVLVLGATGAVGRIAVQASELLGATMVVGASRGGGAGTVRLDGLADVFGPEGFTVCIDPIWGQPLADVLAYAAKHARVVHLGQSAGAEAPLRSADVRGKELQILGHSSFAMTVEEGNRAYLEVLDHVSTGRIALPVACYPLDRAAEAWERQRSGPGGKVVITL
ncbi:MAG TPA: zinc-binding alcohol dehydrogenase family protein [Gaiellaceae bacterium]|nr:zinc-binding alcohol dehydrogenase family protein [Gaiellaceae bacterium]